jgi:hypothetical protein
MSDPTAPPAPLSPVEYQRLNELIAKSEVAPGLTADEYAELEALHEKATAYASSWSADPAVAFEMSFSALQHLTNAVRMIAALTPVGHALDGVLKQTDMALLASGRAVVEPQPVPPLPPPPGEPGNPGNGAASAPPSNRDVPYVSGTGAVGQQLSCTMGNWEGTPSAYSYKWQANGTVVAQNGANYTVQSNDVGRSIACVVTATNAAGSGTAPPSNPIYVQ